MSFIQWIRDASLDDGTGLTGEALYRLRSPPKEVLELPSPCQKLAIRNFMALEHSSEDVYKKIRARHLQPRSEVHRTCCPLPQAADRLQHKCNVSPRHAGQHLRHSFLQLVALPMQPLHHSPRRHLQPRLPRCQQPKQALRTNGKVGARDPTKAGGKLFIQVKCCSN